MHMAQMKKTVLEAVRFGFNPIIIQWVIIHLIIDANGLNKRR